MQNSLDEFVIHFVGLKLGEHQFEYKLGPEFFAKFDYPEYSDSQFTVSVKLEKKENRLEFEIELKGGARLRCDLTNELFWKTLNNETHLEVKFGESYDDSHDEILILPETEHRVNLAQYFYELAVLARPLKILHPDVEKGKKGQEELRRLEELSPGNEKNKGDQEEIDPRWNKLKDLLN